MEHPHRMQSPRLAAVKLLAVIGFLVFLALIVWIVVQGLRAFPNAFSSLASIAETIDGYRASEELEITLEKNIVNSGETFKVLWTDMRGEGTYHFSYTCAEGVLLSVRADDNIMRDITCTEDLALPKEANGLFISATSRAQRFSDLTFSVRFDAKKGDDHITESRVTVVNAVVPTKDIAATTTAPVVTKPTPVVTPKPVTPTPITPKPKPSVPVPTTPTYVTVMPTSDPNGFVDLNIRFAGAGTMTGNTFTPVAAYDEDDRAGLRFEVKNIGTKRSNTWTYTIELPGGTTYKSDAQPSLEPNERALFTLGFEFPETNAKSITLKGEVSEANDTNSRNDTFSWSVKTN